MVFEFDALQCEPTDRVRAPFERVRSHNGSRRSRLKSVFDALEELAHLWCYAEDLESFETACRELVNSYAMVRFTFG